MFKRLTRLKAIIEHRKMWTGIYEQTLIQKRKVNKGDYFDRKISRKEMTKKDVPVMGCYCCEYAAQIAQMKMQSVRDRCQYCPLKWNTEKCFDTGSYYEEWEKTDSHDYVKAAQIARKIALLPIKG